MRAIVSFDDMARPAPAPRLRPLDASTEGYLPIGDYGVIGNLRTAALVGRNGSIDWCCLPELDAPSVFAALLDRGRGGCFQVGLVGATASAQRYLPDTNVLETQLQGPGGRLRLVDFMPLEGSLLSEEDPKTAPELHRLARCEEGTAVLELTWSPRFDYARRRSRLRVVAGGAVAVALALADDEPGMSLGVSANVVLEQAVVADDTFGPVFRARLRLTAGQEVGLVSRFGSEDTRYDLGEARRRLDQTVEAWRGWVQGRPEIQPTGPGREHLVRSELVLKLLTHPDSGAIAAAATTSLPEVMGGVRNWDYRYGWVRDSAFTVQALLCLDHWEEAHDFFQWIARVSMADGAHRLSVFYGLHGQGDLPETTLDHLEGYRGSRPVRIGNRARSQNQHDIYGELLDVACEFARRGHPLDAELRAFLARVADQASSAWRQPDEGLWEVRNGPRHFVYSKVMCWVALDRALELARTCGLRGDVLTWTREREAIRQDVLGHGFDREKGAFVQAFGSKDLDAANLLLPLVEFLPFDDPRVVGTIEATVRELLHDGLVARYHADDGLPGREGAFGLCTFWLIDVLALSGRLHEARQLFESMLERSSPLGLYSEEVDPRTGELLGNFPQAFTHIGLINSALYLARAEGRAVPSVPERHGAKGEKGATLDPR